jgi:AcrR family transcriptional regulator
MARPADPNARGSLLAAARGEFVRHGILKARIEDITHACGLSKGAFYLHFASKEALFREVVELLQGHFETLRTSREAAYAALITARRRGPNFLVKMAAIDRHEDRKLLELLWEWRDVTHVLLHGSQGTEFEGVMWAMLDHEVARVEIECRALKASHLVRDDVPGDVLGMMIVGTYLLVARRLSTLEAKPDFDRWVQSLQTLIAEGTASKTLARRGASPQSKRRKRS